MPVPTLETSLGGGPSQSAPSLGLLLAADICVPAVLGYQGAHLVSIEPFGAEPPAITALGGQEDHLPASLVARSWSWAGGGGLV